MQISSHTRLVDCFRSIPEMSCSCFTCIVACSVAKFLEVWSIFQRFILHYFHTSDVVSNGAIFSWLAARVKICHSSIAVCTGLWSPFFFIYFINALSLQIRFFFLRAIRQFSLTTVTMFAVQCSFTLTVLWFSHWSLFAFSPEYFFLPCWTAQLLQAVRCSCNCF